MRETGRRAEGQTDSVDSTAQPPVRPSARLTLRSALKQIVGMPDYARYLAHAREAHPGCPLLSEREFYDRYLSTRYGNGGSRCC